MRIPRLGIDLKDYEEYGGITSRKIGSLEDNRWDKRCRSLYQLPAAA